MILHLRVVPGFWIAVEERRRPELRSHPVIMGGLPGGRGLVREVNAAAQYCGVQPGMTLAQAHGHCPDGVFLLPDLPEYEAIWARMCAILGRYTPLVEPVALGQAFCDLSGCERQWPDMRDAARDIVRQCIEGVGIAPQLGMAGNRIVAELASVQADASGVTLVDGGQERAFLAPLPLTLLPGIDARMALTFSVLGLTTIGQFAALPPGAVRQRFGAIGGQLHAYARGIDPRPIVPPPPRPAVVVRHECEDGSPEEAMAVLEKLADTCAAELQRLGLAGTLVTVRVLRTEPQRPSPQAPLPRVGEGLKRISPPLSPPLPPQCPGRGGEGKLPVPYRIHSMLPQPGNEKSDVAGTATPSLSVVPRTQIVEGAIQRAAPVHDDVPPDNHVPVGAGSCRARPPSAASPSSPPTRPKVDDAGTPLFVSVAAVVRTPIDAAPPLLERAQRLLLQLLSHKREGGTIAAPPGRVGAIELEVSEFAQPVQLAFAELDRLTGGAGFRGMDSGRMQALLQGEHVLAARYGDASFRHVGHVDPRSVLTERRFRWVEGLPWEPRPLSPSPAQGRGGQGVRARPSSRKGRKK